MEQLAWLHATPEGEKKARIDSIEAPEFPEVDYGAHLIGYVFKFGEISYTEIKSWCQITRTPLTAWEAETMMRIRGCYDTMKNKASKKGFPAPYATEERIAETLEEQFDQLWRSAD